MEDETLVSASQIQENPFIYNAPVRSTDFSNREKIIEKLQRETVTGRSQGNVWVTGERQVGKTSLLRYIQYKYEHYYHKINLYPSEDYFNVAIIYLNVQDTKDRIGFYRNLRQSLKDFFDFKIEALEDSYKNFIAALEYLYVKQKY
ncbi:MAG: ATP-binding protein, partial [bacterium]|nr:ATP-binding protein [bacterium]